MTDKRDKIGPLRRAADPKHLAESSPNPHGESNVIEMPIRTHQRKETQGRNVGQTTNTVAGELNPSVAHDLHTRKPAGGAPAPVDSTTTPGPGSGKGPRGKEKRP
jgi:hypothetical protein